MAEQQRICLPPMVKDFTGRVIGNWTVEEFVGIASAARNAQWRCRCVCGSTAVISAKNLARGPRHSCGCIRNPRIVDLSGKRFGRLTVGKYLGLNKSGITSWECVCDCGTTLPVRADKLVKRRGTRSCGCKRRDSCIDRSTTHRGTQLPEYRIWWDMNRRCHDPNNDGFIYYGARGIKVCKRWRRSFLNFYADMGKRPTEKHSIERKDTYGDYKPNNCKWATTKEQARNTRRTVLIRFNGKEMCRQDWANSLGCTTDTLKWRLEHWSLERALTTRGKRRAD